MAAPTGQGARVVVVNPESGTGDHLSQVSMLADEHGFELLESGEPGEAVTLAERAAPDASLVAACGGDGTVNEVVRGVRRAGALDGTTLGVVPAGTGNNFAEKIGVESITQSFDVLVSGETRRIDLGVATVSPRSDGVSGSAESTTEATEATGDDPTLDGGVEQSTGRIRPASDDHGARPFVNSCVCGITAEASVSTSHDQKDRLGTLAYVLNTLQEAQEFDPIPLHVETGDGTAAPSGSTTAWSGDAVAVLVGNGRRFPASGTAQANMEDGLFEVAILEDRPALDLVGGEARRRLLDAEGDHITRLRTSSLTLSVRRPEPTAFSLDGELVEADRLELVIEPRCMDLRVGPTYDPDPDR